LLLHVIADIVYAKTDIQ